MGVFEALAAGAFAQAGGGVAVGQFLGAAAAAAAVPAAIGAVALGAISADKNAQAQENAIDFQESQLARNEKRIRVANKIESLRERSRSRARLGQLESSIASSGLGRSGSNIGIINDELIQSKLNESIVLSRGRQSVEDINASRSLIDSRRDSLRRSRVGNSLGAVAQGIGTFGQFELSRRRNEILGVI